MMKLKWEVVSRGKNIRIDGWSYREVADIDLNQNANLSSKQLKRVHCNEDFKKEDYNGKEKESTNKDKMQIMQGEIC